jgi:hypothetical protein
MSIKYHAKNGLLYLATTGSGTPALVPGLREYTMDGTQDDVDTTEFGATNRTSVLGFPAYRATAGGFWTSDDTTIRQASQSADGSIFYIYPSRNAMTKYIGGPAWVDLSLRGAVDAAVGTSLNIRANGTWTNNL